jgi:hypothetical protein
MSPYADRIRDEVGRWAEVVSRSHGGGGVAFRFHGHEIGHVHGRLADLPFPRETRRELVSSGRAEPHHVLPDSGWVTFRIRSEADLANAIDLFRLNYERLARRARLAIRKED